jgi:hypothetical protein
VVANSMSITANRYLPALEVIKQEQIVRD